MADDAYESRFTALEYALKHLDKYADLEYTLGEIDEYDGDDSPVTAVEQRIKQAATDDSELDTATTDALLDVLESAYVKAVHSMDAEKQLAAKDSKKYVAAKKEAGGKNRYRLRERIAGDSDEEAAIDAGQDVSKHNLQESEYQQDMEAILDMVGVVSEVSDASRDVFMERVGERQEDEQKGYDAKAAGD